MTTSSRKVEFTADARRDLRETLRFSRERWSKEQSDRYARILAGAMKRLALFPDLGERRDDFSAGLRALPIERHDHLLPGR